jgi:hypothetical protein
MANLARLERKGRLTGFDAAGQKYRTLFEESKDTILFRIPPEGSLISTGQMISLAIPMTISIVDPAELYYHSEDRKRMWQKLLSSGYLSDYEVERREE